MSKLKSTEEILFDSHETIEDQIKLIDRQSQMLKNSYEREERLQDRNWFLNVRADKLQRQLINWKTATAILFMITLLALFGQ